MKPTLLGGETVQISSLGGQLPRIGEILLLCDRQGNILLHRLIRRKSCRGEESHVQTKGDACSGCDESVPLEQVLGRVSHILPSCELYAADTDRRSVKNLEAPLMRLKSFLIVGRFLAFYFLRKAGIVWQQ
ncbi:MAG: hypothetical protein D3925_11575 [Candidatus Electrothrix sp. AR5]|nr:hypothetical protein [Candidatus Electrothrix sp. AR5]